MRPSGTGSCTGAETAEREGQSELTLGSVQTHANLLDRSPFRIANALRAFSMRARDLVRQRENEAPIILDLLLRRLSLQQLDRVTQVLQTGLLELLDRVEARVVSFGLGRHDLVE